MFDDLLTLKIHLWDSWHQANIHKLDDTSLSIASPDANMDRACMGQPAQATDRVVCVSNNCMFMAMLHVIDKWCQHLYASTKHFFVLANFTT